MWGKGVVPFYPPTVPNPRKMKKSRHRYVGRGTLPTVESHTVAGTTSIACRHAAFAEEIPYVW